MDIKSLSYFVAAYEEGNITAAAKRCHISQPSISSAISGLEGSLGIAAFVRHKKGVTATQDGEKLYLAARRLLSDAAALEAMFKPASKTQPLTLGLMTALDAGRVMALLKPLMAAFETLDLRLTKENEACDGRIICEQAKASHETFVPLWCERFVVVFPEGHPLTLKEELFMADIDGVPMVARDYCGNELMEAARMTGLDLNLVATAFSEEWALELVAAGVGIAIIPEGYLNSTQRLVSRSFSNMELTRTVGIAYSADKKNPEPLTFLVENGQQLLA